MPVRRWVFDDLNGETWTVPLNPNELSPLFRERQITMNSTTAVDGRDLVFEGRAPARQFSFGGTILNESHHELLRYWVYGKIQKIQITDHFGRDLLVLLTSLDADPEIRGRRYWYHKYTVNGICFDVGDPDQFDYQ